MNDRKVPRGLKPLQISFFSLLGQEKPKPIPPKLVLIYGYPLAAMISQLLFWKGMEQRRDGLIYKTEKEFIHEIGLSSAQQKLAIKKGRNLGFLQVVRKGIPAKRHYRLNYDQLIKATIAEAARKNIVLTKGYFKLDAKRRQENGGIDRSITYNTTETTSIKHKAESISSVLERFGKKL